MRTTANQLVHCDTCDRSMKRAGERMQRKGERESGWNRGVTPPDPDKRRRGHGGSGCIRGLSGGEPEGASFDMRLLSHRAPAVSQQQTGATEE